MYNIWIWDRTKNIKRTSATIIILYWSSGSKLFASKARGFGGGLVKSPSFFRMFPSNISRLCNSISLWSSRDGFFIETGHCPYCWLVLLIFPVFLVVLGMTTMGHSNILLHTIQNPQVKISLYVVDTTVRLFKLYIFNIQFPSTNPKYKLLYNKLYITSL